MDPADEPTPDPIDGFDALEVVEHHRSRHTFDNDAAQDSFAMEDPPSEEVRLDPRFASAAEPATEVIERDALEAMRNEVTIGSPVSLPPSVFRYDVLPAVSAEVSHEPTGFMSLARKDASTLDDNALPTQKISRDLLAAIELPVSESTVPTLLPDDTFERRRAMAPPDDGALDELSLDDPVGTEPEPAHARPDAETTVLPDAEAPQPLPPSELWTGPSSVAGLAAAPTQTAPSGAHAPDAHAVAVVAATQAAAPPEPAATPAGAAGRSARVATAGAAEESGPHMGPVVGVIALIGSGGVLAAAAGLTVIAIVVVAFLLWPADDDAATLPPIDLPAPSETAPVPAEDPAADGASPEEIDAGDPAAVEPGGGQPVRRRPVAPAPVEVAPEPEPVVAPVEEVIDVEPLPEPEPEPERKGGLFKKRR